MSRIVEFEDGFESLNEPTEGFVSASSLLIFDSDADYVEAKGEPAAAGDIYYNSVLKQVRTFNGDNWRGSGVVTVLSSGAWVAADYKGAIWAIENGVEVYKFEKGATQKIQKVLPVPSNYPGGPIFTTLPIFSPAIADAARYKLTVTLVNPTDSVSADAHKSEVELVIEFDNPADQLHNKKVFLTLDGEIDAVVVSPEAKLKLELERIDTNPLAEGTDTAEEVKVFKYSEETIYE